MIAWLGIDGALGAFSAALVTGGVSEPRVATGVGKDALERGLVLVDEVLGGLPLGALTGIAVGTGPGSFTGMRIALGFAKSLAFAAGVPLASASSYDAVVASDDDGSGVRLDIVHGRAGFACLRIRRSGAEPVVACGDYAELARRVATCVGGEPVRVSPGAPAGTVSAFSERGIIVQVSTSQPTVPALAIARFAFAGRARAGSAHAPRADYGERAYYERDGATPAS